jgi:hypothetical protein
VKICVFNEEFLLGFGKPGSLVDCFKRYFRYARLLDARNLRSAISSTHAHSSLGILEGSSHAGFRSFWVGSPCDLATSAFGAIGSCTGFGE